MRVVVDRRSHFAVAGSSAPVISDGVYNHVHTVPAGTREVVSVPYIFGANQEYWVRISLTAANENFPDDNQKMFRFLTISEEN